MLHRNQIISYDLLYDALWPSASGVGNSSSLKVAVHALRKSLDQAQSPAEAENSSLRVRTCDSGYKLEARNVWIDYTEFESLINRAHLAQRHTNLHLADDLYTQATQLYDGDFLPGLQDDWAATQREWLRSRQLFALGFLSERRLRQGDHLSVIDLCGRMLAIDCLHEASYRTLIRVHAELGQLAQAQRWYTLCTKRLRDELQVAPDHETQRVYTMALRGPQAVGAHR
ncbi:AfsR/SARP family transcriptional regulator [Actinokineospora diospyrosa]|uniref:Transcriptional regulatory protein, C terminal n=1 Tax=Actinokineospora diospyrosa TaxID=103728 RepID=A0ABT1IMN0_9PSEU|nr:BTAD domain-containing putative transcriptional regulator [Actinokineospora diospyrosa]MCP2273932.1 Transcriptional regulatory protein, C terminal [Actinokineospora diospyrosa]